MYDDVESSKGIVQRDRDVEGPILDRGLKG